MCDLCSTDKKQQEQASLNMQHEAQLMKEFALMLDEMARGHLKPHSDNSEARRAKAHAIIRYLVDEWM